MRTKKVTLRSPRVFSQDFKVKLVKDYESGNFTIHELSTLHQIAAKLLYEWVYQYSSYNKKNIRVIEMTDSSTKKVKELFERIKELEQIVGQKQMKIDFLEKKIEIAETEFDVDFKKKSTSEPSTGSGKTDPDTDTK
jgi:transposase